MIERSGTFLGLIMMTAACQNTQSRTLNAAESYPLQMFKFQLRLTQNALVVELGPRVCKNERAGRMVGWRNKLCGEAIMMASCRSAAERVVSVPFEHSGIGTLSRYSSNFVNARGTLVRTHIHSIRTRRQKQ